MLPQIPVHVVKRGNNRQRCFYEEQDRTFYLFHLGRLLSSSGCALHAYCLMTNHVHLLLTANSASGCARLMKHLGQLHSQYMNRNYGRSGSLWEGRFRSCLVQSEDYVLACYRYIESNPVRAGLASHPAEYTWSSYRANADGVRSALVAPHDEYLRLGSSESARREAYRALFGTTLEHERVEEIRAATNGNFALGSKPFMQQISAVLGRRAERGSPGRPPRSPAASDGQPELFTTSK
ncbi:MAG: transposase [Burkholderiales bacterium]